VPVTAGQDRARGQRPGSWRPYVRAPAGAVSGGAAARSGQRDGREPV